MALKTYTKEATLSANIVLKLTVTEDTVGTSSQNYSNCTATLQLVLTNQAHFSASYISYSLSGDTSASGGSSGSYSQGTHTLLTKTYQKAHGGDGTGSTSVSGNIYVPAFSWDTTITASGALTPIARYAAITSFTVSQRNETSLTVNWKTDSTIDTLAYKYKKSGGSWTDWIDYNTPDGTSGSFNVTGLDANSKYYFHLRVRRKDSQLTTDWPGDSPYNTTHQYPYVSAISTNSLKIGNSQTVTLYNPLGRNVTVYMKQTNTSGTTLYSGTTTGTSLTFTPNATTLNNSIPNATSGNAVYYCTYSSQTVQTKSGTYYIDNSGGTYNPTFSTSNWGYTANCTALTNNNQVVISGIATVTFNVSTSATPKNGATIKSYKVEWGTDKSDTITGTTGTKSLVGGTSNILKVTAVDSRNYSTSSQISLGSNLVLYFNQTLNGTTEREDGIGTDTTLSFNGTFFNNKFGTDGVQNEIQSVTYYTSTDNSNWGDPYTIPVNSLTINGNNYSLSNYQIHLNGTSDGFPIGTRYYIKVTIQDKMRTGSFTGILVTDGKIAVDCYQDSNGDYHRGINGLASSDCNQLINGTERVTKALMIPKNGSAGYGICNSDGMSILRDHNNQNVVLNSTGKALFLGYQNTTSINILNGAATIDANGNYSGSAAKWNGLEDDSNTANTTNTWIPVYSGGKMQHTLRAIWSSKQHSNYNNNQDYLATLSTLSYWNGAYNSSNSSNLTYAHQGEIQCKSTQLYNNTNGSNGTITLSASSANYTYLDIYFLFGATEGPYSGPVHGFVRVYAPNGKVATLNGTWVYNSSTGATQTVTKQVLINTNKITNKSYSAFNVQNNSACWSSYANAVYITRVDGWK